MDSGRWADYAPRPDDIIVATYPKCGTTWTQRIVDLLIFQSPAPRQFSAASPWLDATFFGPIEADLALIEAQTHRRYVKSHMPLDAIPVYEGVKVIHTARDGRDACTLDAQPHAGLPAAHERADRRQRRRAGRCRRRRGCRRRQDPRDFFLQWMATAEAGPRRSGRRAALLRVRGDLLGPASRALAADGAFQRPEGRPRRRDAAHRRTSWRSRRPSRCSPNSPRPRASRP